VQDWDDPEGAIDWPVLRQTFRHIAETGQLPDTHRSHDHLNWQAPVPIPDEL
jgi:nicotinamide/nicotinate riboside kinase